jgi:hypothetical protein
MKFEPHQITDELARMLHKAGRADLVEDGFEIDDATLARSQAISAQPAHAIYHALFDRSAPHASAIKPPAVTLPEPDAVATPLAMPPASAPKPSQLVHWIQIAVLIAILAALCATRAKAQTSSPLILRGSNGASILVTRGAGLINLKCDGTTVTCAWSGTTNTITISAGSSISNYYTSGGNTGIGPTSYTPTDTFDCYDATPTTGSTNCVIRAGAGQGSNALLTVENNAGTTLFSFTPTGFSSSAGGAMGVNAGKLCFGYYGTYGGGYCQSGSGETLLGYDPTPTTITGTKIWFTNQYASDTGTGWTVATNAQTLPVAVSALPACSSTSEGTHAAVIDSTAALTSAGAVVAGSGSNHVPVICDGTNWRIG